MCKMILNRFHLPPDILVNFTTGTIGTGTSPLAGGKLGPTNGPISCLEAGLPESQTKSF